MNTLIYRYNKETDKLEISNTFFNKKDIGIISMKNHFGNFIY